jgi:hypothetical protein
VPEPRFRAKVAEKHMQMHFPNCPQVHCDEIVRKVAERTWENASIGKAVGIVVTNYIRHRLTDYEVLMRRHRLTREEARAAEAGTVKAILQSWQIPLDQAELRITILSTRSGDDIEGDDDA